MSWTVQYASEWIPRKGPQHPVKITQPFYLGKCQVTQAQWEAVMGNNPSTFPNRSGPVDHHTLPQYNTG